MTACGPSAPAPIQTTVAAVGQAAAQAVEGMYQCGIGAGGYTVYCDPNTHAQINPNGPIQVPPTESSFSMTAVALTMTAQPTVDINSTFTPIPTTTEVPQGGSGSIPTAPVEPTITAQAVQVVYNTEDGQEPEEGNTTQKTQDLPDGWQMCQISSGSRTIYVLMSAQEDCAALPLTLLFQQEAADAYLIPRVLYTNVPTANVQYDGVQMNVKFVDFDKDVMPIISQLQACSSNASVLYCKITSPDPSVPKYGEYRVRVIDVTQQSQAVYAINASALEMGKILVEANIDMSGIKIVPFGSCTLGMAADGSDCDIAIRSKVGPNSPVLGDIYNVLTSPQARVRIAQASTFLDRQTSPKLESIKVMLIPAYENNAIGIPMDFEIPLESAKLNALQLPAHVPAGWPQ